MRHSAQPRRRSDADTDTSPEKCAMNLQVFVDGSNDDGILAEYERGKLAVWRTSVAFSAEPKPGCWSWPPRT